MGNLYSSFSLFEKAYKSEIKKLRSRDIDSLVFYFKKGGIIKTKYTPQLRVVYPSKQKIKEELIVIQKQRDEIASKLKDWQKIERDARTYVKKIKRKRFFDSVYWKHKIKTITDRDYREEVKKLKIPLELIADPKLKKIISAFMDNQTYRNNIIDTLENSIVYKEKGLGEQILQAIEIKRSIANKKIKMFSEILENLDKIMLSYKVINRWVSDK